MPHQVTLWQCDFCNQLTEMERPIINHELHCSWNPAAHHCNTCDYRKWRRLKPSGDRCYRKGNGHVEELPWPQTCEHWKRRRA